MTTYDIPGATLRPATFSDEPAVAALLTASSLPLDPADPLNPMNRRISLVVLNDKTERQIRGLPEETMEEIQNEGDAAQVLGVDVGAEPGAPPAGADPGSTTPVVPQQQSEPPREQLAQPAPSSNPA